MLSRLIAFSLSHRLFIALLSLALLAAGAMALRDLPIDVLKLDQSFITELTTSPTASAMVEAVIRLADALDLIVTHAPVRMSDVASLLRVDPSTATRTVAKLQQLAPVVGDHTVHGFGQGGGTFTQAHKRAFTAVHQRHVQAQRHGADGGLVRVFGQSGLGVERQTQHRWQTRRHRGQHHTPRNHPRHKTQARGVLPVRDRRKMAASGTAAA